MSGTAIPMQGRLSQFDGSKFVNDWQNAPLRDQARSIQSQQMNDEMMARALQKGQASPQAWDAAMQEAAQAGVPEASQLVGQWNPLKAAEMLQQIEGRTRTPSALGVGSPGKGSIAAAAGQGSAADPGIQGGGPGGAYNFDAVPKEKLQQVTEGMGIALDMLKKPGLSYQDFTSTIDFLKANGHPEAEQMRGAINELNFADKIGPLMQRMQDIKSHIDQRFAPEQMGLPYQAAAPAYKGLMSEAGPVIEKTPPGGGAPSYDFAPVGGAANPAFLPQPKAAAGGDVGPGVTYGDDGKLVIDPTDRKRLQYAVDYLRKTNHMLPLGFGKAGVRDRQLVTAMAGEDSSATGGAGGDIATVSDIKADQKSLGQLQKMADTVFAFEKNLKMNLDVVKKNMPEGAGADLGPWINRWIQSGRTESGSTKVPPYVASIITAMNEYAKITEGATGAAGASVEARKQTAMMLNGDYSKPTVLAVIGQTILPDLENRKLSFQQQLQEIKDRIKRSTSPVEPAKQDPGVGNTTDTIKITPQTSTAPSWYKGGK